MIDIKLQPEARTY